MMKKKVGWASYLLQIRGVGDHPMYQVYLPMYQVCVPITYKCTIDTTL
jgi:hypothetical protein